MSVRPSFPPTRGGVKRRTVRPPPGLLATSGRHRPCTAGRNSGSSTTLTVVSGDTVGQIILAVLALGVAVIQYLRSRGGPRAQLREEAELLQLLPEGETRDRLAAHVDSAVAKLISRESELRRDPSGIVLGLAFIAAAIFAGYFGYTAETLVWAIVLWLTASLLGLLGIVGFVQDVVPRKRDEKGRPIE